jgi:putative addiction module component (TIGR02574 family)
MTSAELLPEIMKLSPDDKLDIADALWRHLKANDPVDEAEFKRELDRRIDDADKHPDDVISWDDLSREAETICILRVVHSSRDPGPIQELLP